LAARWSSLSFAGQSLLQFFARFVSHRMLPKFEFGGLGLLQLLIALAHLGAEVLHLGCELVLDLSLRLRQYLCFAGFDFGAHLLVNSLPGLVKCFPLVCQRLFSGGQDRLLCAAFLFKIARELFADAM
jgi:hypothetical protein